MVCSGRVVGRGGPGCLRRSIPTLRVFSLPVSYIMEKRSRAAAPMSAPELRVEYISLTDLLLTDGSGLLIHFTVAPIVLHLSHVLLVNFQY